MKRESRHELLKYQPEGLEGMDDELMELMKKNLHGRFEIIT
jgi:hypothetical protein